MFLASGEKASADQEKETDLSQEELLKKTVYIEHWPKKDPRDLRVLDPACGSGHFLLYAFDLLERIYEEAWEDPESPKSEITGQTLREDFETLKELRRAVPVVRQLPAETERLCVTSDHPLGVVHFQAYLHLFVGREFRRVEISDTQGRGPSPAFGGDVPRGPGDALLILRQGTAEIYDSE